MKLYLIALLMFTTVSCADCFSQTDEDESSTTIPPTVPVEPSEPTSYDMKCQRIKMGGHIHPCVVLRCENEEVICYHAIPGGFTCVKK